MLLDKRIIRLFLPVGVLPADDAASTTDGNGRAARYQRELRRHHGCVRATRRNFAALLYASNRRTETALLVRSRFNCMPAFSLL